MTKYKQPSIEAEGIEPYLDRTKDKHNGIDFKLFTTLVESGVNKTNLARAMGIRTIATIRKYLSLYRKSAISKVNNKE